MTVGVIKEKKKKKQQIICLSVGLEKYFLLV